VKGNETEKPPTSFLCEKNRKAKEDKNLESQAKTNSLFVVSVSDIQVTHHT
jgi:hypothetical protein